MNFYASPDYLDAIAEVYFKRRKTRVVDVQVGDDVLRLLEVDEKHLITNAMLLDYHEPLDRRTAPTCEIERASRVARGVIEPTTWDFHELAGLDVAPYVAWSMFPTWDDYQTFLSARRSRVARELERRARSLVEHVGEIAFSVDDPADDVLDLARRWKGRPLRATGLRDIFVDPKTTECLQVLRRRRLLTTSTLRASGRLLAAWIGFIHERVWSGWVLAFDPELAQYSVSHRLLTSMLEESHRLGHREFDFSIGAERYKLPYATHGRLLGSVGRAPPRRHVVARAWHAAAQGASRWFAQPRGVDFGTRTFPVDPRATAPSFPSTSPQA